MTKILVTGGSGALGREIVKRLANFGYNVRVMSRRPARHDTQTTTAIAWVQGNLASGQGLAEAVADVDIIVHAASDPLRSRQIDVNGTRLLLTKARETGVVSHVVYISIVGIDRIPYGYYTSKLEAEERIKQSGIPWSILRATQFHTLLDIMLRATTKLPLVLFPADLPFQVLDPGEAADRLCEIVAAGPSGSVPDLGGPEVLTGRQLMRIWLKQRGLHRLVIPLWLPGKAAYGFRHGFNTCGSSEARRGTITWSEWVQKKYMKQ